MAECLSWAPSCTSPRCDGGSFPVPGLDSELRRFLTHLVAAIQANSPPGVLARLRDIGATLLSLNVLEAPAPRPRNHRVTPV